MRASSIVVAGDIVQSQSLLDSNVGPAKTDARTNCYALLNQMKSKLGSDEQIQDHGQRLKRMHLVALNSPEESEATMKEGQLRIMQALDYSEEEAKKVKARWFLEVRALLARVPSISGDAECGCLICDFQM